MGGVESKSPCEHPLNPDILSVLTLSDSAVQRLPLEIDDTPLDKEFRNQNIDDFWRDRLECLEQTHSEIKRLTEKEFQRLEFSIKKMSNAPSGKLICPSMIEDAKTCYLTYPRQSLNCSHIIEKLQLCLDTVMQEGSKNRMEINKERAKRARKRC